MNAISVTEESKLMERPAFLTITFFSTLLASHTFMVPESDPVIKNSEEGLTATQLRESCSPPEGLALIEEIGVPVGYQSLFVVMVAMVSPNSWKRFNANSKLTSSKYLRI